MKFIRETNILFGRTMRCVLRSPDTILTVVVMPLMMMLLFVYVFGGAVKISLGADINYVNYQLPGILLITVTGGVSYTAYRIFMDVEKGIFTRFNSMPISRSALLWAHIMTSIISIMLSILVIISIALIMGFRSSAGVIEWCAVAGIVLLFSLALTWFAVLSGIAAKTLDGATAFSMPIVFLPMLSSAFVPTETMPKVVRFLAENQPATSIVNTIRSLLNSESVGKDIWVALAWCVGIIAVAWFFAMRAYKRKV